MNNCELDKEEFYFKINNVFVCDFFFLEKEKDKQHRFTWHLHESKKNKITWELDSYGYRHFYKSLNVTSTRCPEIEKSIKKYMKQKLKEKQKELKHLSQKIWDKNQILTIEYIRTAKTGPYTEIKMQVQFSIFSEPITFHLRNKEKNIWVFIPSYTLDGRVFEKVELCYLWKCNEKWFQSFINHILSHPNTRLQFLLHA